MLIELALVVLLALCNGFFALSEMALVASRKIKLKQRALHSRGARVALRQMEAPERFLSTVQVGITLVMLITGSVAGDALGDHIAHMLQSHAMSGWSRYAHAGGIVIGFAVISFLQIVVGELVPKRLALAAPERLSSTVALPMLLLSRICAPFVLLLNASSGLILRWMRVGQQRSDAISEDEIRLLVAEGTEQGVLDPDEQKMVNRVLRLGDRTVDSVMTPRMRISWLNIEDSAEDNLAVIRSTAYARYPVYRGDQSDIVGVVEVRSLLRGPDEPARTLFRSLKRPLYVPGAARALDLLNSFRDADTVLALVVDEYGEIEGLITINDLLAAVIGASQIGHGPHPGDEPGDGGPAPAISPRDEGGWLIGGSLSNDDLRELLKVDQLPGEKEHEFHTAAGMVMSALGHLPQAGEVFMWHGFRFEVLELRGARIERLAVIPPSEQSPADDAQ